MYLKKILALLIVLSSLCFINFVSAQKFNFYNFAYIKDTAYLNFNGQINGINYEVSLDDESYNYFTGNDGRGYHCYKVVGSGYTDTLGEVYFSYAGNFSYLCADGKWRGLVKLGAGGWLELEDMDLSDGENRLNHINKDKDNVDGFFYHSRDGLGNFSGQVLSKGIGFWHWNYVKTDFDVREKVYDLINVQTSILDIQSGKSANGIDKAELSLKINDFYGRPINGLHLDSISFSTGASMFWFDDAATIKSGLYFKDYELATGKAIMRNANYLTGVYSIMGLSGLAQLKISYKSKYVNVSGNTFFIPPLSANLSINDGNGNGRLLMGDVETANLTLNPLVNVSNVVGTGQIDFLGNGQYVAKEGRRWDHNPFDLNVSPYNIDSYVDNKLGLQYSVKGTYSIKVGVVTYNNVPYENLKTNTSFLYPDKRFDSILVHKNCSDIVGNGKDICELGIKVLNSKGYSIPSLTFNVGVDDANKISTNKSTTFDLNELTDSFENGLFLNSAESLTNNYGLFKLKIVSYKPVVSGSVLVKFNGTDGINEDIYSRAQGTQNSVAKFVNFSKAVQLGFTGDILNVGLKNGENNLLKIFSKKSLISDIITNFNYDISGRFLGCQNCVFENGGDISGNGFNSKDVTILFTGKNDPDFLVYDMGFVNYDMQGDYGTKNVRLLPNVIINNKPLKDSSGLYLMGTINKGYNLFEVNKYNSKLNVFGSEDEIIKALARIKNSTTKEIRGKSPEVLSINRTLTSISSIGTLVYKCDSGIGFTLGNGTDIFVTGKNKIVLYDCPLLIKSNIYKANSSSSLSIVSFGGKNEIDYNLNSGWKLLSNIYIYPNVSDLFLSLSTNGSIFFSKDNFDPSFDNIFLADRELIGSLKKQIYIKGKIVSRNILGGAFRVENKIVLPGGAKFSVNSSVFGQSIIKAQDIGKAYDINFWRVNYVDKTTETYSFDSLSVTVKNNNNCSGKGYQQKICIMPVVVEDD